MRGVIDTMDTLITGPTLEPLDLEEVKKQRRFGSTSLDTLFDAWGSASRQHFETLTGRALLLQTWEYWLSQSPCQSEIELPRPPLQSVAGVHYDDDDGEQTFDAANYTVSAPQGPQAVRGRLTLVSGASWPTIVTSKPNALRIRYVAGYGAAPGDVPELVHYALMMLVGHFHKFGEEVQDAKFAALPMGAQMVLNAYKYTALPTLLPRCTTWD